MERISKRVRDLIEKGTLKERALLFCKEQKEREAYFFAGETPTLNQKEADALLYAKTEEEKVELQKWLLIYYVYDSFTPRFALGLLEYYRQAHIMEGYLRLWKEQEDRLAALNQVNAYLYKEEQNEELRVLLKKYDKELYLRGALSGIEKFFKYGKLRGGYRGRDYTLDLTKLKKEIEESRNDLIEAYTTIKAIILTLEHFGKKTSSQKFLPERIKRDIGRVKRGYLNFDIGKEFSCKELRLREERGETITNEEREKAVFPEYNSLKVSKREREFFEGELITVINEIANVKTKE